MSAPYLLTRIEQHYYLDNVHDGDVDYHSTDVTAHQADSIDEAATWLRADGVRFDAYGDGIHATDPDGSTCIDYATGEQSVITWVIAEPAAHLSAELDALAMLVDRTAS